MSHRASGYALVRKLLQGRRNALAALAGGVGSLLLPGALTPASAAAPTPAPRNRNDGRASPARKLVSPAWDDVPACTPSATDRAGQGPFFIHDGERDDDVSLFREDIRGRYDVEAEPGTELQLHLRVLNAATSGCGAMPLRDVEVYVWHCDAQGYYSGFGEPGEQQPDQVYRFRPNQNDLDNNTRFCRGAAVSDANGVVSFRSIFPGWYNGRDIHVHVMVLRRHAASRDRGNYRGGDHLFTTQLYFDAALIDQVHRAAEPYRRRTAHPAYGDLILGDERGSSGLRMKASVQPDAVVSQMQLII